MVGCESESAVRTRWMEIVLRGKPGGADLAMGTRRREACSSCQGEGTAWKGLDSGGLGLERSFGL